MVTLRFQRPCPVILIMIITILPPLLFGYPVILNITEGQFSGTIGLGDRFGYSFGEDFESCICDINEIACLMRFDTVEKYIYPQKQALSEDNVGKYRKIANFFQCRYSYSLSKVRCHKDEEQFICSSTSGKINIIIACPDGKIIVLDWASEQNPRVLSFDEIPVIDCCITSYNLTQLTTISTTPTTTFSTPTTTDATTTSLETFNDTASVRILQSSSPTPDFMTISSTHSGTTHEQNRTNYESPQISSQQISTFVVSAVVAILVTLAIVGIYWRLKSRRQRKESLRSIRVSGNVQETSIDNLTHGASDGDNASRTIGLNSTLV